MAQTIEDVNGRTLLQQFHSLYEKQDAIETNVENVDAKVEQEKSDRQTADANLQKAISQEATERGNETASLRNDMNTNTNKIEYNTTQITALQRGINENSTKIDANTTQISALQNGKQDKLTAGANITIENNIISASGGLQEVKATDVDSEQATHGQVLTANGSGGASWQNASGGNTYLHNIQLSEFFKYAQFYIISKSKTTFRLQTLQEWLYNNGFRNRINAYGIGKLTSGRYITDNSSIEWVGIYSQSPSDPNTNIGITSIIKEYTIVDNAIKIDYNTERNDAFASFTDSVIEL